MSTERLSPEDVAFLSKMADDIERTMRQTGVVDDAKWQQIARNEVVTLRRIAALLPEMVRDGARWRDVTTARPVDDLHEDHGPVLLWSLPVDEPPDVGSSLDDDFPGRRTHFTPLHAIANALAASLTTPDNG